MKHQKTNRIALLVGFLAAALSSHAFSATFQPHNFQQWNAWGNSASNGAPSSDNPGGQIEPRTRIISNEGPKCRCTPLSPEKVGTCGLTIRGKDNCGGSCEYKTTPCLFDPVVGPKGGSGKGSGSGSGSGVQTSGTSVCAALPAEQDRLDCEAAEAVFEAAATAYCVSGGDVLCTIAKNNLNRLRANPSSASSSGGLLVGYDMELKPSPTLTEDVPFCNGKTPEECAKTLYFADQYSTYYGVSDFPAWLFSFSNGKNLNKSDYWWNLKDEVNGIPSSAIDACTLFKGMWDDAPRPVTTDGTRLYLSCSNPDTSTGAAPAWQPFTNTRCALIRDVAQTYGCSLSNAGIQGSDFSPRLLGQARGYWTTGPDSHVVYTGFDFLVGTALTEVAQRDEHGLTSYVPDAQGYHYKDCVDCKISNSDWGTVLATIGLLQAAYPKVYRTAADITVARTENNMFWAQLGYDACRASVMEMYFSGQSKNIGFMNHIWGYDQFMFGRGGNPGGDCELGWKNLLDSSPELKALGLTPNLDTGALIKASLKDYYKRHEFH